MVDVPLCAVSPLVHGTGIKCEQDVRDRGLEIADLVNFVRDLKRFSERIH